MTKHTPGPWRCHITAPSNLSSAFDVYEDDGRGNGDGIACTFAGEREAESQANARLIAAAPDLLEACRSAAAVLESIGFEDSRAIRQTLRRAITKAEGSTS